MVGIPPTSLPNFGCQLRQKATLRKEFKPAKNKQKPSNTHLNLNPGLAGGAGGQCPTFAVLTRILRRGLGAESLRVEPRRELEARRSAGRRAKNPSGSTQPVIDVHGAGRLKWHVNKKP